MIELLFFLGGVVFTFGTGYVFHRIQVAREERSMTLIGERFQNVTNLIAKASSTVTALERSLQQLKTDVEHVNQRLQVIPDEIDRLTKQADAIAQVRDGLAESMNEFKSFVQTLNAIQEHGVEIVTKDEQHPDLHDKVVLLFAKQSVGMKIFENIGSALGGAVAGAATGYFYGKGVEDHTPLITHETHATDFRLQNIEACLDDVQKAIQALRSLIDERSIGA